ncbi:MAG: hypothetical protein ACFFAF_16255 [Candidatus Hermodarchaeota archaeon]
MLATKKLGCYLGLFVIMKRILTAMTQRMDFVGSLVIPPCLQPHT